MSGEIVEFKPRRELEAEANLREFVRVCREELAVFGRDLDWDSAHWPAAGVAFGNLDQKTRTLDPDNVMREPFLGFAKAYFRYQQGHKPTKTKQELRALKCVERALTEFTGRAEVHSLSGSVLDRAADLARQAWSRGQAYRAGQEMQRLANFVSEKELVPGQIDWRNPIGRPRDTVRTGEKAKQEREKKLPAEDALDALASIFASEPSSPRDTFTTCVCAMLLCAPSRVSEILSLTENCEVWDRDSSGKQVYGWRFQPGKGAAPMVKWIPDNMVSLAQEAIGRVRTLSAEARRIARWHEEHPREFYPHPGLPTRGYDGVLDRWQIVGALGLKADSDRAARNAMRTAKVPSDGAETTLSDLQKWVRSRLPKTFPWFDSDREIRYSEALFCLQRNQLHASSTTSPVLIWRPTANIVNRDLETTDLSNGRIGESIFDRHRVNDHRGHPLKVTSHQFRHLLNTMAQRGGLDQASLAKWSGRADAKQNRAYDHMSEGELVEMIRSHDPELALEGSLAEVAEQIGQRLPMTRQEFNTLTMPTAHITEFGFCVHDFTMSPCQKFRDCLNCTEQIYVKGDRRLSRLEERYEAVRRVREQAEEEIAEGAAGADRWYEIHALTESRLKEMMEILRDPSIPDGSLVNLRNEHEFSPMRRAVEAKADGSSEGPTEKSLLEAMRSTTGGGFG